MERGRQRRTPGSGEASRSVSSGRRVVHLIDTGGPGGAESIYGALAAGLEARGWQAVPVVPEPGWLQDRLRAGGLDPVLLESRRSFDVAYLVRLVRMLRRTDADLVHAHLLASSVYGSVAAVLCGLPSVCTFHGTVDVTPASASSRLKLWMLDRPDGRVVFVSEALRRRICADNPLDADRTRVIHNGIDVDRYRRVEGGAFRRELGVDPEHVLVGAVGNVRPAKDYRLFLEVAERLRERDPRYRFVVVGDRQNELGRELERQCSARGLDDVLTFAGLRDDVPEVLAGLDLYLLTSSSEGFSLSTVEAMASGLPVVATRCGGPEEIIEDGVDGRLVEASSARALAEAVGALARDSERARRMGRAARRTAEKRFSVDRMIEGYADLYDRLVR